MEKKLGFRLNLIKNLSLLSIVIGIIGIIVGLFHLGAFLPREIWAKLFASEKIPDFFYVYIFLPLSFIGLIAGAIGFKLKVGKTSAILGITFSIIALLIWLFIWFWIIGWSMALQVTCKIS